MNIELIKAEIALLEPQAKELWDGLLKAENEANKARNAWHPIYTRIETLKSALTIAEESK